MTDDKRYYFQSDSAVPNGIMVALCDGKIVQVITAFSMPTTDDIQNWPDQTVVHISPTMVQLIQALRPGTPIMEAAS